MPLLILNPHTGNVAFDSDSSNLGDVEVLDHASGFTIVLGVGAFKDPTRLRVTTDGMPRATTDGVLRVTTED